MSLRILAAGIAGLAAVSLAGCFAVQEKTFGEALDNTSAGSQIRAKLISEGGFSRFGEVDVEVEDRLALLVGRVPSEADRIEAERIAWTVNAVDEIANELVIDKRSLLRDINDPWIASQVRARMVADGKVKSVNYNIHVYNGVVYLMGIAESEDELRRAAEHASKVGGVKKVVSYVKMRERGEPSQALQAANRSEAAAAIAPDAQTPAPIVPPQKPTTRAEYGDPYATDAAPPPGSNNSSLGLQSAPLPPAN